MIYVGVDDPYLYRGSCVLKNRAGIRDPTLLEQFEAISTATRAEEPLPTGQFSKTHFMAVHRHLFQDVYAWAGRPRRNRISKGSSMFCFPEHIHAALDLLFQWLRSKNRLRGLDAHEFARGLAHFLAELNAIHAFREGNGRTQLIFAFLISVDAGYPLNLERLDERAFLSAMIESFSGHEESLAAELASLI